VLDKARLIDDQFQAAADVVFDAKQGTLLVPEMKAGTLTAISVAK